MALKLETEHEAPRGNNWKVNPFDIEVRPELRGRHFAPTKEEIIKTALTLLQHEQQQAVKCRRLPNNKPLLVFGYTRWEAACLIVKGFEHEGVQYHNPEFALRIEVSDANDETAFIQNIVENCHRNQTSDIDDAHNQQKLRAQNTMSDADITRLYRYNDPTKVGRLKRLLVLPEKLQELNHYGKLTTTAALDILDLTNEAHQKEMFEWVKSQAENGKVSGAAVRSKVREFMTEGVELNLDASEDDDDASNDLQTLASTNGHPVNGVNGGPVADAIGAAPVIDPVSPAPAPNNRIQSTTNRNSKKRGEDPKFKPRSNKEIRTFVEGLKEHPDKAMKKWAKSFLMFMNGRCGEKSMSEQMDNLLDATRDE